MQKEENRNAGILLNITGNGKGKTTSAFGITIRALGWGWKVGFLQFVKGNLFIWILNFINNRFVRKNPNSIFFWVNFYTCAFCFAIHLFISR